MELQIHMRKSDCCPTLPKPTCGRRGFTNELSTLVKCVRKFSIKFPFELSFFTVFDEDFVFEVRPATIGRRTLEILLYDFDAYSRHVCIGGLKIQLAHVDLSDKVELWKSLGPCAEQDAKVELGDLMISLSYLPSAERLTAVVIKARNLRVFDDTRNSSGKARWICINCEPLQTKCPCRSVRESINNPQWEASEEEEDYRLTQHSLPRLQRGADL